MFLHFPMRFLNKTISDYTHVLISVSIHGIHFSFVKHPIFWIFPLAQVDPMDAHKNYPHLYTCILFLMKNRIGKCKNMGFFLFFLKSGGKMGKIDSKFNIFTVFQVDPMDAHKNKHI